ncbi:hypothetical protein AL036_21190, partial [Salipiger aestuarii]|uniref:hypothetical protein n=1 Tax=Salipiger aestuarii TaxID=568098 RepID=UPI001CC30434
FEYCLKVAGYCVAGPVTSPFIWAAFAWLPATDADRSDAARAVAIAVASRMYSYPPLVIVSAAVVMFLA